MTPSIIVYTGLDGRSCEQGKEFLSRAGARFEEKNVEEDPRAYRELVRLGWRTVPVTLVGERAIKGFDPGALTEALKGAGAKPPGSVRAAGGPPPDR